MGPPGTCRPQMGPMLAPWTLLSGYLQDDYLNVPAIDVCNAKHKVILKSLLYIGTPQFVMETISILPVYRCSRKGISLNAINDAAELATSCDPRDQLKTRTEQLTNLTGIHVAPGEN